MNMPLFLEEILFLESFLAALNFQSLRFAPRIRVTVRRLELTLKHFFFQKATESKWKAFFERAEGIPHSELLSWGGPFFAV